MNPQELEQYNSKQSLEVRLDYVMLSFGAWVSSQTCVSELWFQRGRIRRWGLVGYPKSWRMKMVVWLWSLPVSLTFCVAAMRYATLLLPNCRPKSNRAHWSDRRLPTYEPKQRFLWSSLSQVSITAVESSYSSFTACVTSSKICSILLHLCHRDASSREQELAQQLKHLSCKQQPDAQILHPTFGTQKTEMEKSLSKLYS